MISRKKHAVTKTSYISDLKKMVFYLQYNWILIYQLANNKIKVEYENRPKLL